jgi:hypothetical protein
MADFIYAKGEALLFAGFLLGHQGTKQGTAKRRLSHVCSKNTVNVRGYHRL